VTSAAERILEDVLSLPEEARRVVAEHLLGTIPREDPEAVAQAWTDEALRRAGALERGEVEAVTVRTENQVRPRLATLRELRAGLMVGAEGAFDAVAALVTYDRARQACGMSGSKAGTE